MEKVIGQIRKDVFVLVWVVLFLTILTITAKTTGGVSWSTLWSIEVYSFFVSFAVCTIALFGINWVKERRSLVDVKRKVTQVKKSAMFATLVAAVLIAWMAFAIMIARFLSGDYFPAESELLFSCKLAFYVTAFFYYVLWRLDGKTKKWLKQECDTKRFPTDEELEERYKKIFANKDVQAIRISPCGQNFQGVCSCGTIIDLDDSSNGVRTSPNSSNGSTTLSQKKVRKLGVIARAVYEKSGENVTPD